MIIVSSCLIGIPCRYDGKAQPNDEAVRLYNMGIAVPVCPECLGGLPTPRTAAEIVGGTGEDVLSSRARVIARAENGEEKDVTDEFILGAQKTLEIAIECGATQAVLKAKSPSCSCGLIYDGSFSGKLREGNGVTAALLLKNGLRVRSL
ncbi:MAG: DUF523 domain-containing protein [Clostridia bacterium]|nr:DUF523 domain-containing protein [Clostridia bacterium]